MKTEYYYFIIALLFSTNLGCYFFVFRQKFNQFWSAYPKKELKKKYFKEGITHAYKHFENQMKIGKIQHRKLLVLFNQMKREALEEHGN